MSAPPQEIYVEVAGLTHRYGERVALSDLHLAVRRREIFGLLGPNGGGKTTLFKILSTLVPAGAGEVVIGGASVRLAPERVRQQLGVVFQQPSVDGKLTVRENLVCHGHLYGIGGARLQQRIAAVLERLALADRGEELVEKLSGGLQCRVELAKALLHQPPLLVLDEPSTGLDPGARKDFMTHLQRLRDEDGVTVILTTHLMEEAERCDRIAILHRGRLVQIGTPRELKSHVGGDVVVLQSDEPEALRRALAERFGVEARVVDGSVRVECAGGHEFVRDAYEAFSDRIAAVSFGKPTLEDAFVHFTGDRFWATAAEVPAEVAA